MGGLCPIYVESVPLGCLRFPIIQAGRSRRADLRASDCRVLRFTPSHSSIKHAKRL